MKLPLGFRDHGLIGSYYGMKPYLVTTGILFGLVAALHAWRVVAEWNGVDAAFLLVAAIGLVALMLSVWAWKLFADVANRHLRK